MFNRSWADQVGGAFMGSYDAEIIIYTTNIQDITYDTETGEYVYDGDPDSEVHSGVARVQPLRVARNVSNNAGDTMVQGVRFQIPDTNVPIRVNQRVRITKCDLNERLTNFEFTIQEIMDASNAVNTTFEAFSDTEYQGG